ncbi:energy transducer TonB [Roseimarinus sediminis]|uniref:energy transducer TonB n=1 Tax=Roseimarinus sediminis TaxID=1610899 RepID=UPI003D1B3BD3
METKKNPRVNLENRKREFFLYGLIISLTLVLLAFKGTKEVAVIEIPEARDGADVAEIFIPPTHEPEKKIIQPPPPLKLFNTINIVNNNEKTAAVELAFDELDDPLPLPYIPEEKEPDDEPVLFAEQMPEFPGGMASLNRWLSRNLVYPASAQQLGLEGRVYLNFVVGKDGSISNINVSRGVAPLLDQEAIRVISTMPKWNPGMQNGVPVKVSYNIFVRFQLN